jgi:Uma2 family endonuclease
MQDTLGKSAMASAALKRAHISVEDYLELERNSPVRHEYVGGQVYAMGGASDPHNTITLALVTFLFGALGGPCRLNSIDMRLRIALGEDEVHYYPDAMVSCDPTDRDKYYRQRPVFLAEVLSPTTERVDRGEKLLNYQQIPTLEEYLLCEQDLARVEIYRRSNGFRREVLENGDTIRLDSLGLELSVGELYRLVEL